MGRSRPNRWYRIFSVLREPEVYLLLLRIYFPILLPLTFLITLVALSTDRVLGWGGLFTPPVNYVVAVLTFLTGAILWTYTYYVFVTGGKGSPSPAIKRTTQLVTWGIYARCRNPSVLGKLLGVLAVGLLVNSPSFTLVLVPLLLIGSMIEKVWRQEPVLVELFGDEYLEYRKRVPLIIPRIFVPAEELRGPPARQEDVLLEPELTTDTSN